MNTTVAGHITVWEKQSFEPRTGLGQARTELDLWILCVLSCNRGQTLISVSLSVSAWVSLDYKYLLHSILVGIKWDKTGSAAGLQKRLHKWRPFFPWLDVTPLLRGTKTPESQRLSSASFSVPLKPQVTKALRKLAAVGLYSSQPCLQLTSWLINGSTGWGLERTVEKALCFDWSHHGRHLVQNLVCMNDC